MSEDNIFEKVSNQDEYILSLNEMEKKALEIAKSHLESSFNIEKSIGYLNWLKKN
jgi:hypothetical protein